MVAFSLTEAEIVDAVAAAAPGAAIVYHRGMLANDCGGGLEAVATRSAFAAREARATAWGLYESGACTLVQRRLDFLDYEYCAVVGGGAR
jgi:hypothetical protein